MKKYKVNIFESVLRTDFTVIEAESEKEAEEIVKNMWERGEFYSDNNQTEIVGDALLTGLYAEEVE